MSTKLRLQSLADLGNVLPHAPGKSEPARATLSLAKPRTVVDPNGKPVVVQSARRSVPDHVARGRDPGVYGAPITRKAEPAIKTQPPPRDFTAALADPFYQGIAPARLPVPDELLKTFANANRVLLVGHVNPDHDTVGAVLTLRAALRALGKEVDVCIDGELTTTQRRLAGNVIKRPEEIQGGGWDLAAICDTSGRHRIGAALDLVERAAQQIVVDHHPQERASADCLIERFDCADASWLEDEHRFPYDAASIQVCAIAERLLAGRRFDFATMRAIYLPALVGMVTDTKWGTVGSLSPLTPHIFKHVMRACDLRMEHIETLLKTPTSHQVSSAIADARFVQRRAAGSGERAAMILKVKAEHWQQLLRAGASAKVPVNESEIIQQLKSAAGQYVNEFGIAILAIERPGAVLLSIQSTGGRARALANLMGKSGGHDNAASTTIHGGTLEQTLGKFLYAAQSARIIV